MTEVEAMASRASKDAHLPITPFATKGCTGALGLCPVGIPDLGLLVGETPVPVGGPDGFGLLHINYLPP